MVPTVSITWFEGVTGCGDMRTHETAENITIRAFW